MKTFILFIFILVVVSVSYGQLTGIKQIPGDYASIALAIADLNTNGTGPGGVIFNVAAGHTETFSSPTAGLITASGTASNPILFQKSGTGTNPKITAGMGTSTTTDGIIKIAGGDYITFDGIDVAENPGNGNVTRQMEWGYALVKASAVAPFDGCQHVTIKNCSIALEKENTASVGIYANNHTATSTTSLVITAPTDAMNNCKFFSNTITNVFNGIQLKGFADSSPYTLYDSNNEVGVDGPNTITVYSGGNPTFLSILAMYGMYHAALKVSNNMISGGSGSSTLYGIHISTGAGVDISNNTIAIAAAGTTSAIYGIYNSSGASASTCNIYGNTVANCSYPTATTGSFTGIINAGTPATLNLYSNSVNNNTLPGTGTFTGIDGGSPATLNMYNNTVNNNTKTGPGNFYCMRAGTSVISLHDNTIHANNISTTGTVTAAGVIYGYYNLGSPTVETHYNNQIYDLNVTGTTTSSNSMIYGMYTSTVPTDDKLWWLNHIWNLSVATAGSGTIYGINSASGATININRNSIHGISACGPSGSVYGIYLASGTSANIYNNMVCDLQKPAANAAIPLAGIYIAGGTTANVYYNTVYLNSTSTGALFGSAALYASTAPALTLRNNIFVNTSTPKGAGVTAAYRRTGTTLTSYGSASNNNCFYAGTPSASNVVYYDGTSYQTLANFKALVTPRDNLSVTESPPFFSTISPVNLHVMTTVPTLLESGGAVITGYDNDYDNDIRQGSAGYSGTGTAPDIGADEFDGIYLDIIPPVISYTPLANTTSTSNRVLTATISDVSGVPTLGIGIPVLYFKINSGSYTGVPGVFAGGNNYSFTFGSGVPGDVISYYVVAQDNALPPNVGAIPSAGAGGFTSNPPVAATPPNVPEWWIIIDPPVVSTLPSTNVTTFSTTLNGTVHANNLSTSVSFEYGLSGFVPGTGTIVPGVPSPVTGNTTTPVSAAISGLTPSTTYQFRVIGTYSEGTSYGNMLTFITPCQLPSAAGVLTGPDTVCQNRTGYVYGVPVIPYAMAYLWSVPTGFIITSGVGTNSITVSTSLSATSGNITVCGVNSCGNGSPSLLSIAAFPLPELSLTAGFHLCPYEISQISVVSSLANFDTYLWSPVTNLYNDPACTMPYMGSNAYSLYMKTALPGAITYTCIASNGLTDCINTTATTVVTDSLAPGGGIVTGPASVCLNGTGYVYTVPAIPGATGYVWSLPAGATITAGANTNSVIVSFSASATSGNITVYGTNSCGIGNPSTPLPVTIYPTCPPSLIYKDIVHNPLGNASMTLMGIDTLVIGNIGSSGNDGVSADVSDYPYLTEWEMDAALELLQPPDGEGFTLTSKGTVSGIANQTIYSSNYQLVDDTVVASYDFTPTGATSITVCFYLDDVIVHQEVIPSGSFQFLITEIPPKDYLQIVSGNKGPGWDKFKKRVQATWDWAMDAYDWIKDQIEWWQDHLAIIPGWQGTFNKITLEVNVATGYNITISNFEAKAAYVTSLNIVNEHILQVMPLLVTIDSVKNVTCHGGHDGNIYPSFSGGTPPYSYQTFALDNLCPPSLCEPGWICGPPCVLPTFPIFPDGLASGAYLLEITDANGITDTAEVTLTEPPAIAILTSSNNVTCYGGTNGSVQIGISGGNGPYTATLINGSIYDPFNNRCCAGIPCSSGFSCQVASFECFCAQRLDHLPWEWTALNAGLYSIVVADGNGCTAIDSIIITEPPPVVPVITGPAAVCVSATGNVYATQTGMTNYNWSVSAGGTITAGGMPFSNTIAVTWNTPGQNTVSVNYTNESGCTASTPTSYSVTVYPLLPVIVSVEASANPVNAGTPVTFSSNTVNGGINPVYQWKVNGFNTGTNSAIFTYFPVNNDVVSCIVTSNALCISGNPATSNSVIMIVITVVPAQLAVANVTVLNGQTFCYNATNTITVAGEGTSIHVLTGGSATFIAGQKIIILPATTVAAGGELRGYIANAGPWCGTKSASFVDGSHGLVEIYPDSGKPFFSIYPNPTTSGFSLELTGVEATAELHVEIYGILGERVLSLDLKGQLRYYFSLDDRQPGMYFIHLVTGKNAGTGKIIKQ